MTYLIIWIIGFSITYYYAYGNFQDAVIYDDLRGEYTNIPDYPTRFLGPPILAFMWPVSWLVAAIIIVCKLIRKIVAGILNMLGLGNSVTAKNFANKVNSIVKRICD